MNRVQKKLIELLKEIDGICRENDIKYSIAENTAYMALKEGCFTNEEYLAEIIMTLENYNKFIGVCSNELPKERVIENGLNNPQMDGVYSRYVDTSTTLIDIRKGRHYKYNGIHVVIRPLISYKPTTFIQKIRAIEVKSNSRNFIMSELKYSSFKKKLKILALIAMKPFFANASKYFKECISCNECKRSSYYYNRKKTKVKVPQKLMTEYKDVCFEDETLMCVADTQAWLRLISEKSGTGNLKETSYALNNFGIIASTTVPFERFLKICKKKGIYSNQSYKLYGDYQKYKALIFNPRDAAAEKDWMYVKRTRSRFELWELYKDKTDIIIREYNAGNLDSVKTELNPYIKNIKDYYAQGMGFCIDNELFDICLNIMKNDGDEKIAKSARKLIPEEFNEPVGIFLSKEGYLQSN